MNYMTKILFKIHSNPKSSIEEIAKKCDIETKVVRRYIKILLDQGYLEKEYKKSIYSVKKEKRKECNILKQINKKWLNQERQKTRTKTRDIPSKAEFKILKEIYMSKTLQGLPVKTTMTTLNKSTKKSKTYLSSVLIELENNKYIYRKKQGYDKVIYLKPSTEIMMCIIHDKTNL